MDEHIDTIGDALVFPTLDGNRSYWQVRVADEDCDKTVFAFHDGQLWITRMPFVVKNAPGTFQRVMDITISSFKGRFTMVYHDDIVIFLK